jgi:hypothetical protein
MQPQAIFFFGLLLFAWVISIACVFRGAALVLAWGAAPSKPDESKVFGWAVMLLLLVFAAVVLWISPYRASNLGISDSVEYTVGAERLLHQGTYSLFIENREFPPRYAPWFSALFLAPALMLPGHDLGNAIWPIFLLSLLGVALAYSIARGLTGTWGGILAALTLLLDPGFRYFSKFPMTDAPASILSLLVLGLCVRQTLKREDSALGLLTIGIVCAVAVALRTSSLFLLFAVVYFLCRGLPKSHWFRHVALLTAPTLCVLFAQSVYNVVTFGSAWRTGYHFWVPWPYDFFSRVFSIQYLFTNAMVLIRQTPVIIFAAIFLAGWPVLKERRSAVSLNDQGYFFYLRLVVFFGAPLSIFYLFYFYSTSRFFLPLSVALYVALGAFIGAFLSAFETRRAPTLLFLIFAIGAAFGWRSSATPELPLRRIAADSMARLTEPNAVLVTAIDPVYLDPLVVRGTKRSIIPLSRSVEFASKVVAWDPLEYSAAPPAGLEPFPREFLLHAGAKEAVAVTALENPEYVEAEIHRNRPVYFETSQVDGASIQGFADKFIMTEVAKGLFRVSGRWVNGTSGTNSTQVK